MGLGRVHRDEVVLTRGGAGEADFSVWARAGGQLLKGQVLRMSGWTFSRELEAKGWCLGHLSVGSRWQGRAGQGRASFDERRCWIGLLGAGRAPVAGPPSARWRQGTGSTLGSATLVVVTLAMPCRSVWLCGWLTAAGAGGCGSGHGPQRGCAGG